MKKEPCVDVKQDTPGVSVIVLTWNGIELIKECFHQIVETAKRWEMPHEIILVDNGSHDDTIAYVRRQWPAVSVISLRKNIGFSRANNIAAKQARYERLLFLNNDLLLEEGFIAPLLEHLEDKAVFAVAPKMLRWDRKTVDDGLRYGQYFSGLFSVKLNADELQVNVPHWVTFFCGACFLCKKELFF